MEIDLSNRTAIVTGGGRGIGEAIARGFAKTGADVVVAARTESEIRAVADELASDYGVRTRAIPTDLTSDRDVVELIAETEHELTTPNVLVNNAGVNVVKPPFEHTADEIETMYRVNVVGCYHLSEAFATAFRDSDRDTGRIINISSLIAHLGVPAMTFYGGTKSGLIGLTRGLAATLAPDGITVNSVSPGLTKIDRTAGLIEEKDGEVFDVDRIPLGRVGEPEDTANACLYLASDLADYVTGTDLRVDGGVTFTAGLYL